ncbi:winged helix DNA-binding domain-containing protein [Actinomadura sp. ATCC 31491]|uniref:Winged helix DNA-binding domain-containing protein n=1 Tax=Actinomadura luzonensis TaxID=2805427 RepID=A0ABT0FVF0_9ACTN|nr:winged helix DNA-binding domain-containing protein [Actinomadura luzonensis]MCK2216309.1 winged helix DNA-binding domain-containing protein [Actinomadura luzonensis]
MLSLRDLNRATLARQHLLGRHKGEVTDVVHRLAGLQAQEPRPPYLGVWSRLEGFGRDDLHAALRAGAVLRATMWRATLHLVTAADFAAFRRLLEPMLLAAARRFDEIDFAAVAAVADRLLAERPHTFNELRPRLLAEFPGGHDRALGYAVRLLTPLAMVPTEDRWSFPRDPAFAPPGVALDPEPSPRALVERYLAAFGPATPADAQTWSGVRGLRPVMEAMELERLAGPDGKELFDLPGAPRPGGDVPAPVRFLPDFDTLVLGHADRARVLADEHKGLVTTKNLRVRAVYLVDGFAAGTWQVKRSGRKARLLLAPFGAAPGAEVEEEGLRMLAFAEPDAAAYDLGVEG